MRRLETLLDQVADALIVGDFKSLAKLTPEIEAQVLDATDLTLADSLGIKAQRNARLLDAASRGVKAARLRLNEVVQGPTLTTYDSHGQKAQISMLVASRSHRV